MPKTLEALVKVQSIEHQMAQVRGQLARQNAAVDAQQKRISQLQADLKALHSELLDRQKEVDTVDLDLRRREEEVTKLRGALNTARTNKEYAGILTQINSLKADQTRLEDNALKQMQVADEVRASIQEAARRIEEAQGTLEVVKRTSGEEVARLEKMLADLQASRSAAAAHVPPAELKIFNRIASLRDGDAMAVIEIHGRKPPHEYSCGGCNMSVTAEHANALRTRDDLRFCDNCGRILYLSEMVSSAQP